MSKITIRTIAAKGITVSADETGVVYINDRKASAPITASGMTFVWAGTADGLPANSKIALFKTHIAAINAHSAAYISRMQEQAVKAHAYDLTHNEGGEGYNPYRAE